MVFALLATVKTDKKNKKTSDPLQVSEIRHLFFERKQVSVR